MRHRNRPAVVVPQATGRGRLAPQPRRWRVAVLAPILFLSGLGLFVFAAAPASATPMSGANANLDRACISDGTGDTDKTLVANDNTANDFSLAYSGLPTDANVVFLGMKNVFSKIYVNVGTAGTDGTLNWYYRNSNNGWTSLSVTDSTNHFRNAGTNTVSWTPPSNWATYQVSATWCSGSFYFIKIATDATYTLGPLGTQVSAVEYNAKVKVEDDAGEVRAGLLQGDFTVSDGTTTTIFGWREIGGGVYEMALDTVGADVNFNVKASATGYATSATLATGSLTTQLADLTGTPIVLKYPIKIVIRDSGGADISGATVTVGGLGPLKTPTSSVFLFREGGALAASKSGYESFNAEVDTKAKDIRPGATQQTVATLSGTARCDGANQVPAGGAVTCRGLVAIQNPSNPTSPSTSSASVSSSVPGASNPASSSSSSKEAASSSGSNGGEGDSRLQTAYAKPGDSGGYSANIDHVENHTHVRLLFNESTHEAGFDVIEFLMAEGGSDVRVEVERVESLPADWSVPESPGIVFGYVAIRIFIGEQLYVGPADFTLIDFRVASEKLRKEHVRPFDVGILRWDGAEWQPLLTDPLGEEAGEVQYRASGPGQGFFSIASDAAAAKGDGLSLPWIVAIVVLVNIIIGALYYAFRAGPHRPPGPEP